MSARAEGPRVGRNDPCPCGSGKKYKKCCDRAAPADPGDPRVIDRLSAIVSGISDPDVVWLTRHAADNPSELKSARFWDQLGLVLGSGGHPVQALDAFSEGLNLAPKDGALLCNLAVTHEQLGNVSRALSVIENVPAGTPHVAVVRGNLLRAADRMAEAVPAYVEAIREEPQFDLPYLNLIECLERLGDPAREVWIDRAVKSARTPAVAAMWARHLFMTDRLEELADADWIDDLRSSAGDMRMIGRRSTDPGLIIQAQVWRTVAMLVREPSLETLQRAAALLPAFREVERSCDPARLVLQAATELGAVVAVDQAYDLVCEDCKKQYGVGGRGVHRGFAYAHIEEWHHAVDEFSAVLAIASDDLSALHGLWWSLDEIGEKEKAIAIAERFREHHPREEHINYNLGLLCGHIGLLGKSRFYYEEQLRNHPDHPYARENLAITLMLDGRLDDAKTEFDVWLSSTRAKHVDQIEAVRDLPWEKSTAIEQVDDWISEKHTSFSAAMSFAQQHASSDSYRYELTKFLDSLQPRLGSTVIVRPARKALGEMATLIQATDAASREELASRYLAGQQGDLSSVIASLQQEIPCWSELPVATRRALANAEFDLLGAQKRDMAMVIVSYAKAVETALKTLVFDPYRAAIATRDGFTERIRAGLTSEFEKAHSFVKFIRDGRFIELGTMLHALRLLTGRTVRQLDLLGEFLQYVSPESGSSPLLSSTFIENCDFVSKRRNAAAHAESFDRSVAEDVRQRTIGLLMTISGVARRSPT
jgi:tetratricopeptide (TPR) repeat protein